MRGSHRNARASVSAPQTPPVLRPRLQTSRPGPAGTRPYPARSNGRLPAAQSPAHHLGSANQGGELVTALLVDGRSIELDKDGFLQDLDDWSEAVAEALAASEGLTLTPEHYDVIHALRRFHAQYQLSPAMRPLVKYIGQELGADKGNSMYLLKLFPGSPAKLASKIAGLPKPDNCL